MVYRGSTRRLFLVRTVTLTMGKAVTMAYTKQRTGKLVRQKSNGKDSEAMLDHVAVGTYEATPLYTVKKAKVK